MEPRQTQPTGTTGPVMDIRGLNEMTCVDLYQGALQKAGVNGHSRLGVLLRWNSTGRRALFDRFYDGQRTPRQIYELIEAELNQG